MPMKSMKTSRFMARARSDMKKQAPFRMQMRWRLPLGYSAEICSPSSRMRCLDLLGGNENPQVWIDHAYVW